MSLWVEQWTFIEEKREENRIFRDEIDLEIEASEFVMILIKV